MIKTQKEYLESKKRLEQEFKTIEAHQLKMEKAGMNKAQIHLAIDPLSSFALQLQEEVEEYERLMRGHFNDIENLYGLGHMLVALRIYKGMKQKDLAKRLDVKVTQVSRDERNEYHGVSIEKVQKVLAALGVTLKSAVDMNLKDAV